MVRQDATVMCCMWISQHVTLSVKRLKGLKLTTGMCDVTISCDSHIHMLNDIASIVVALVPTHGECWLAYLLAVCNHKIAL